MFSFSIVRVFIIIPQTSIFPSTWLTESLQKCKNKESGLPDSRAGARLRQQPFSLSAKCASLGGFCFIGNEVSYKTKKSEDFLLARFLYLCRFFFQLFHSFCQVIHLLLNHGKIFIFQFHRLIILFYLIHALFNSSYPSFQNVPRTVNLL